MAIVIEFIKQYAPWVYGACALAALWYLRVVILARRERRHAVFTLERETALNRVYGAWVAAIVLMLIMGAIYLLSTVVSDAVQPLIEADQPTPTATGPAVVGVPAETPTLPLPDTTPTGTPTRRPRPTARPQATPMLQETPPPALQRPRCADARAAITAPSVGAEVSGMVPIFGTATHEDFQYYKLEYGAGAQPGVWSYFDGGDRPVQNGQLGTLNAGALPPGTYALRVVVVDTKGNYPDPCQTTVVIR